MIAKAWNGKEGIDNLQAQWYNDSSASESTVTYEASELSLSCGLYRAS